MLFIEAVQLGLIAVITPVGESTRSMFCDQKKHCQLCAKLWPLPQNNGSMLSLSYKHTMKYYLKNLMN